MKLGMLAWIVSQTSRRGCSGRCPKRRRCPPSRGWLVADSVIDKLIIFQWNVKTWTVVSPIRVSGGKIEGRLRCTQDAHSKDDDFSGKWTMRNSQNSRRPLISDSQSSYPALNRYPGGGESSPNDVERQLVLLSPGGGNLFSRAPRGLWKLSKRNKPWWIDGEIYDLPTNLFKMANVSEIS